MSYLQQFGISRISPLNLTEKEENPATSIISDENMKAGMELLNRKFAEGSTAKAPPSLDANILNDPNFGKEDSFLRKAKTVVSHPFHSLKRAMNPNADGYRDLTTLRQGLEAAEKGNKEAESNYQAAELQDMALGFLPPALAAQTVADAASGNLMGAFIGKYSKKFKRLKKPVQKGIKALYYGSKAIKRI
tara:strand:- start:47 stop:616 length:570 start_codon:yes stop_codon:yes gene_type:complete